MAEQQQLRDPWLIGVWPGMGGVAMGAGGALVGSLGATLESKLPERQYFDIDYIDVKKGLIHPGRVPRTLFFNRRDPGDRRDMVIMVGEAQPKTRGYELCHRVLEHAAAKGVSRVVTFAAMAAQSHPAAEPRVLGAGTTRAVLDELDKHGIEPLGEGQIGGLNGALLGAAAQRDMEGMCLLAEVPFFAAGLPNPKSTLAVLRAFSKVSGIETDLSRVEAQAAEMEPKLLELLERLNAEADEAPEAWMQSLGADAEEESADDQPKLDLEARRRIENLFQWSRDDRSRAVELKRELDRLGVFKEYEDRFLDLFRRAA